VLHTYSDTSHTTPCHPLPPPPRALYEFGSYAFLAVYKDSFGMTFKDLRDPQNGVVGVWIILAAEWVWFMGLAWYLEQVFASGTGNRKHPLFFLKGWSKKVGGCMSAVSVCVCGGGGGGGGPRWWMAQGSGRLGDQTQGRRVQQCRGGRM
jgi:hypothetical protein